MMNGFCSRHVIEVKENIERNQNKELEEAKRDVEAFKRVNQELQRNLDNSKIEISQLREQIRLLEEKNRDLQLHNIELTTKEEEHDVEDPQPTPAVPAPAVPAQTRKLNKWVFCQYLLDLDRETKKYYNTFRNKWVIVMNTARAIGGQFQTKAEQINNTLIRSLIGMIAALTELNQIQLTTEVSSAISYLQQAQREYPNA